MLSILLAVALSASPPVPTPIVPLPSSASARVMVHPGEPDQFILIVRAEGIVPAGGWEDIRLVRRPTITAVVPDPRYLDLVLVGEPPDAVGGRDGVPEKVGAGFALSEPYPAATIKPIRVVRVYGAEGAPIEARIEGPADSPRRSPDRVVPAPGSGIPDRDRPGMPH
jgi:hypothetical protein